MFFNGDHFADQFNDGGGGGRRQRGGQKRGAVDTTKLYETLGVAKTATPKDIKTAYRKLAVQHHPDKGGDEQRFKEINAAYQILADPEKRTKYDKYGLDGLEAGGGGGGSSMHEDLFSMFFGGAARGGGSRRTPRGEDVNQTLKVTLEDLYNGKTVKMAITRQVITGEPRICTTCDGEGVVIELRRIGLGMVQQIQRHCTDCDEGYRCVKKSERKVVEVMVEKGMRHKQKIVLRGMADEKPNMEAGNVNFILQETPHDVFKRKGADLLISKTLSLKEALTGFAWRLQHLDKRDIVIKSKAGEVIKAETAAGKPFVKIVPNEGMPCQGNPFVKGNLYVLFSVKFPNDGELSTEALQALRTYLPGPTIAESDVMDDDDEAEVVHLTQADVKLFGHGGITATDPAYDSDDEAAGPQAVNCQQS